MFPGVKYTYKTHYYCMKGCGPHAGWIEHGKERSERGMFLCPYCGNHIRTRSRHGYGKNRAVEPIRI